MIDVLVLVLFLGFTTYRVTRFVVLDSLIENVRSAFYEWLLSPLTEAQRETVLELHEDAPLQLLPMWRRKLYHLFSCPFCISVWVAGGAVILTDWVTNFDVKMPVWTWLATSTVALVCYAYIDAED
jgi:hypothetical protein